MTDTTVRRRRPTAARPPARAPRARTAAARAGRAQATAATLDAIRRVVRVIRLSARRTEGGSRLSPAQLFVLTQLADGAPASLSELAARTLTDRSSVAAVVERLAERRLVTRETSEEDRRRAAVRITATGRALLRRAPRAPTSMLLEALDEFDDAELDRLAAGLTRLTELLGVASEPASMLFEEHSGESAAPATPATPAAPRRRRRDGGSRA